MYKKINDMAYTDFIAAIDLGTSRIVGMVGKKTPVTASGGDVYIMWKKQPIKLNAW